MVFIGVAFLLGCGLIALFTSSGGAYEGRAAYVKEVVSYREGEKALVAYFIISNADGEMISSGGTATLSIMEDGVQLYIEERKVDAGDFSKTKRGRGAFEQEVVLYSFDRIAYSEFSKQPTQSSGDIKLTFVTLDGRKMEGTDTILFDQ